MLAPHHQRGANGLNLGILGEGKSILYVNSKVADRIVDLAMTEQDLDSAQVTSRPIDDRRLSSTKRVGAIFASHQTDPRHPFVDKPGILASTEMTVVINPARKNKIVHRAASAFKPGQKAGPSVRQQFKLNRPARFLLHHYCSSSDLPATDNVANFHLNEVATSELAVDRKVEQRPVS